MSTEDIRNDISTVLHEVPGVGGPGPSDRKIHKYTFEVDNEEDLRQFWQISPTTREVNGVMIGRIRREDIEPNAGKEYGELHDFKLLFRYGKPNEPLAEKTFEGFVDAIQDKFRGNDTIFKRNGNHPQPYGDQVTRAEIRNVKLFGTRIWQAEIFFRVVIQAIPAT